MALKPTIYKAQINLADSDRNCYEQLSLTLARHPSETLERLAVRLLVYCLHCERALEFTRGISSADEPDLWQLSDSGEIEHWIELGQPEEPRLRKACGRAQRISVYAFGRSAATWWNRSGDAIGALPRVQVWQFDWDSVVNVSQLLTRNAKLGVSIVGGTLYVDDGTSSTSLELESLLAAN
ncbi:MAG: YaeQ family protein [Halieaceae bacterium]|jgi:uncharacterized protein YaeQ|nr:YaeQ family protein [Halieaceae bacterium]